MESVLEAALRGVAIEWYESRWGNTPQEESVWQVAEHKARSVMENATAAKLEELAKLAAAAQAARARWMAFPPRTSSTAAAAAAQAASEADKKWKVAARAAMNLR
jgi:hypothetical protein